MDTPPFTGASLGLLCRQVLDAMWARMEVELAAAGHALTFSQFITIKTLAAGTAGVTELARAAHLHPGAMTRLLDRLEARGILARVADPADRRALHIDLTADGRALWREIERYAQHVRKQATAGLPEAEQAQLMRLLTRVRDNLSAGKPR